LDKAFEERRSYSYYNWQLILGFIFIQLLKTCREKVASLFVNLATHTLLKMCLKVVEHSLVTALWGIQYSLEKLSEFISNP
jgi:hypothetical protein